MEEPWEIRSKNAFSTPKMGRGVLIGSQGAKMWSGDLGGPKKAFSAILVVAFSGPIFGPFLVPEPLGPIGNLTKAKSQGKPSQECLKGIANSRSPWQHGFSCFSDFFVKLKNFLPVFSIFHILVSWTSGSEHTLPRVF